MKGTINEIQLRGDIRRWLNEDMPYGDVTSQNLPSTQQSVSPDLLAKEPGVLCGMDIFRMVFDEISDRVQVEVMVEDGAQVEKGQKIARLSGPLDKILMGERLALNLLQRLSGIATMAHAYAQAVKAYDVRVVDTRKTTPGLRQLEKYAVRVGGCYNHRYSLSDAVMIKDNHIKTAGSISQAVATVRGGLPHTARIEVEVEALEGLKEAIASGADIIMLDNMDNETMKEAVAINDGKAILEASGNMSLERLPSVAATGVDVISVGALTHSVSALDISLKFR